MTLQQLNNKFRYKTDKEQYGVNEHLDFSYWRERMPDTDKQLHFLASETKDNK